MLRLDWRIFICNLSLSVSISLTFFLSSLYLVLYLASSAPAAMPWV